MSDLFCPGCSAELEERQLLMTYIVTEKCPRCRAVVRKGDGFRYGNTEAIAADDIESIGAWLASESEQLRIEVQQIRDDESKGEFRWLVGATIVVGCPENWAIEAFYSKNCPNIFSVKLVVTEPELMEEDETESYIGVLKDHGLQLHGISRSGNVMGVSRQEMRWGTQQHFNTNTLPQGLLKPVVTRLVTAMRDVMTTREGRKP